MNDSSAGSAFANDSVQDRFMESWNKQ